MKPPFDVRHCQHFVPAISSFLPGHGVTPRLPSPSSHYHRVLQDCAGKERIDPVQFPNLSLVDKISLSIFVVVQQAKNKRS